MITGRIPRGRCRRSYCFVSYLTMKTITQSFFPQIYTLLSYKTKLHFPYDSHEQPSYPVWTIVTLVVNITSNATKNRNANIMIWGIASKLILKWYVEQQDTDNMVIISNGDIFEVARSEELCSLIVAFQLMDTRT